MPRILANTPLGPSSVKSPNLPVTPSPENSALSGDAVIITPNTGERNFFAADPISDSVIGTRVLDSGCEAGIGETKKLPVECAKEAVHSDDDFRDDPFAKKKKKKRASPNEAKQMVNDVKKMAAYTKTKAAVEDTKIAKLPKAADMPPTIHTCRYIS